MQVKDRVQHAGKHYFGTIEFLDDKEALVKNEVTGQNNLVARAWLVAAPKPKPTPFKPGWYRVRGTRVENFIYYVSDDVAGNLVYSQAYNPKTGEMDLTGGWPVLIAKVLVGIKPGDLIRQKFVTDE